MALQDLPDDHTCFVGTANGGIWVHNDCVDDAKNNLRNLNDNGLNGQINHVAPAQDRVIPNYGYFHDFVQTPEGQIIDNITNGSAEPVSLDQWATNFVNQTGQPANYFNIVSGSGNGLY